MNRIYRLVWNAVLGAWVPASELTKARGKRGSAVKGVAPALLLAVPLLYAPAALSATTDVTVPRKIDINSYQNPGVAVAVDDGGTVNLSGNVEFARQAVGTRITYAEAQALGYITGPDLSTYNQLVMAQKSGGTTIPDPVFPGSRLPITVYTAADFQDGILGEQVGPSAFPFQVTIYPAESTPYVKASLGTVSNGTLNVNLAPESNLDLGAGCAMPVATTGTSKACSGRSTAGKCN